MVKIINVTSRFQWYFIQNFEEKYFHIVYYICDRIQAISSVFPGMSKTEQMSLCGFAKKMENELFANARTKVLTIYFCRLLDNSYKLQNVI